MLGKTADGLVWMARYLERAENTARLVEVAQRLALTGGAEAANEWQAIVAATGNEDAFRARHGGDFSRARVSDFLLRDRTNPSSAATSIAAARTNARVVRTALTREVWEAINDFHLDVGAALQREAVPRDLGEILTRIRRHGAQVRGSLSGTMLRNAIYDFADLGTFLERADATARILSVKYYVLLPHADSVGGELDNAQWEQLLRSLQVNRAFIMVHGSQYSAQTVGDFLILDPRMPRSLVYCLNRIRAGLERRCDPADAILADADAMHGRLARAGVEQIIEGGLHEFLDGFLADLAGLASALAVRFRFYA